MVLVAGASEVTGQVTVPATGSSIVTPVRVTLPVFVTTNVYGIVAPAALADGVPACLSSAMLGFEASGVVTESVAVTGVPVGGWPVTVAVFATWPASTSDCDSVYVAVQVVLAPGARVVTGQATLEIFGSATAMPVSVTLPVFVTRNV